MHLRRQFSRPGLTIGALLLASLAIDDSELRAQMPLLPHVIPNECQLECCRLGQWSTTFSTVPVYPAPGTDDAPRDTIPVRTSFAADSTVVVVRQVGIAVVETPVPRRFEVSPPLASGDTVYLLRYEGDDFFTTIVRGRTEHIYAFWEGKPGMSRPTGWITYGRVLQNLKTEWWVHVRLPTRRAGWINMTHVSSVHGPDACSE